MPKKILWNEIWIGRHDIKNKKFCLQDRYFCMKKEHCKLQKRKKTHKIKNKVRVFIQNYCRNITLRHLNHYCFCVFSFVLSIFWTKKNVTPTCALIPLFKIFFFLSFFSCSICTFTFEEHYNALLAQNMLWKTKHRTK